MTDLTFSDEEIFSTLHFWLGCHKDLILDQNIKKLNDIFKKTGPRVWCRLDLEEETEEDIDAHTLHPKIPYRNKCHLQIANLIKNASTYKKSEAKIFPICFVDQVNGECFVISYSRSLGVTKSPRTILLPLEYHRTTLQKGLEDTIPYSEKSDRETLFGRFALTGPLLDDLKYDVSISPTDQQSKISRIYSCLRVQKSGVKCDLGLVGVPASKTKDPKYTSVAKTVENLKTSSIPLQTQFEKYAHILCLEGEDVSTSLMWALSSYCVPFCPYPFVHETWAFEKLKPMVHFVPIHRNMDNIKEMMDWAIKHPSEMEKISMEGKMEAIRILSIESSVVDKFVQIWPYNKTNFGF